MIPRRLSAEGKILLTNIIPAIKALAAGSSFTIDNLAPLQLAQIRRHLYNYFTETSSKPYYRTIVESATSLRVICKDLTPPPVASTLNSIEAFVAENLLDCATFDDAQAIAHKAWTEGTLTDKELLAVMEEWETKCGEAFVPSTKSESNSQRESKISIDPFNGLVEDEGGDK